MNRKPPPSASRLATPAASSEETSPSLGRPSARPGSGKDVTDKFLAGPCPACRRRLATDLITSAVWILHQMPPVTRTVCLGVFGRSRTPCPPSSRSLDYLARRCGPGGGATGGARTPRRALRQAPSAMRRKAKRHGRPKMVLIGDIVGRTKRP